MRKNPIKRIEFCVLTMIAALLLCGGASGQSSVVDSSKGQSLRRVIRKNGWRVPGRDEFKTVLKSEVINFAGTEIVRKTLQATDKPLIDAEGYTIASDGQLVISQVLCEVQDVFSYELNGSVFAYETRLVLVSVDMHGNRERTGAMFNLWYYDDEGNGRFESRVGATELQKIPGWAKLKNNHPNKRN